MDTTSPPIQYAIRVTDECARWDCRRLPPSKLDDFCGKSCLAIATSDSKLQRPFGLGTVFSKSPNGFAPIATKIFNLLKLKKESGVPRLDLLKIPPWQSNMFSLKNWDERDKYRQWLFIGMYQIPLTLDFKWVAGRSKMIGDLRHCVFNPFPREDNNWKLHQYSSPDFMESAVYVMHYNKTSDDTSKIKKTHVKKRAEKRKWPPRQQIQDVPVSAEDEETDRFLWLYSDLEGLERAASSFALARCQNDDKKKILESVSEEIHLQMENIKSHILAADVQGLEATDSNIKVESQDDIHKTDSFARLHSEKESFQRAVALFSLARENVEKRLKSGADSSPSASKDTDRE